MSRRQLPRSDRAFNQAAAVAGRTPNERAACQRPAFGAHNRREVTATRGTSLSRSRIYELIQSGDIETVTVGRAMLVKYRDGLALLGEDATEADPYPPTW